MDGIEQAAVASSNADRNEPAAALIERWFAEQFHNSPISRDTQCWNHAVRAKERLIEMLTEV
jgi:hypothetical protein